MKKEDINEIFATREMSIVKEKSIKIPYISNLDMSGIMPKMRRLLTKDEKYIFIMACLKHSLNEIFEAFGEENKRYVVECVNQMIRCGLIKVYEDYGMECCIDVGMTDEQIKDNATTYAVSQMETTPQVADIEKDEPYVSYEYNLNLASKYGLQITMPSKSILYNMIWKLRRIPTNDELYFIGKMYLGSTFTQIAEDFKSKEYALQIFNIFTSKGIIHCSGNQYYLNRVVYKTKELEEMRKNFFLAANIVFADTPNHMSEWSKLTDQNPKLYLLKHEEDKKRENKAMRNIVQSAVDSVRQRNKSQSTKQSETSNYNIYKFINDISLKINV